MGKQNGIMMQYFHWYYPADGSLWNKVSKEAKRLAELGVTALWLPPAYKGAAGKDSVGYDVYDIYDLGEFDQRSSVRTKYGTKDEYLKASKVCHENGIDIYADVVLNHKGGADATEVVRAQRVEFNDRNRQYGEPTEIEAWTKFDFPGRNGKYSEFKWDWTHFDGVDWDERKKEKAIFMILGHGTQWEEMIEGEMGNYDYLMFADLDFTNVDVRNELERWGEWYVNFAGVDGFRLDAIKHISFDFFNEWLDHVRKATGKELFTVGEYWNPNRVDILLYYLEKSRQRMSLFDAPLHKNFHVASKQGAAYDMRNIFNNTLLSHVPHKTVSLVENHDTQPLQALEAPVEPWFKPLAYAIILLREAGYPCVFYADLYGSEYTDKGRDGNNYHIVLPAIAELPKLMQARKLYAWGHQRDYFDFWTTVGWTREGDDEVPGSGCAVILSNGDEGHKWMDVGIRNAGKTYYDYLGKRSEKIVIDENGWAQFFVNGGSVSVWVAE